MEAGCLVSTGGVLLASSRLWHFCYAILHLMPNGEHTEQAILSTHTLRRGGQHSPCCDLSGAQRFLWTGMSSP
jgi:hypothetical protein